MSSDLQRLGVVLDTKGLWTNLLRLNSIGANDRLAEVHLTILDLRDGLREDRTDLSCIKEVSVDLQASDFGIEHVEAWVLTSTVIDECLQFSGLRSHLFELVNECDLSLEILLKIAAIIFREGILVHFDIELDLLRRSCVI